MSVSTARHALATARATAAALAACAVAALTVLTACSSPLPSRPSPPVTSSAAASREAAGVMDGQEPN